MVAKACTVTGSPQSSTTSAAKSLVSLRAALCQAGSGPAEAGGFEEVPVTEKRILDSKGGPMHYKYMPRTDRSFPITRRCALVEIAGLGGGQNWPLVRSAGEQLPTAHCGFKFEVRNPATLEVSPT